MIVRVLQHHPAEGLGTIARALEARGLGWETVRAFAGEPVPRDLEGVGGLVVMGGPMGVYERDRHPFLDDEMRLIERAMRDDKPVLGVCLGSQLVAAVLGAEVRASGRQEIGWFPVRLSPDAASDPLLARAPETFVPLHWHGDVFDLPRDAIALASSEMTPIQAFRYGARVHGFLFHLECTEEQLHAMTREFGDPSGVVEQAHERIAALEQIACTIFSRWAESAEG